jgi:hypothetical protein
MDEAPKLRQQSEASGSAFQASPNPTPTVPLLTSPRERRLLAALLDGPLSREALDKRIGASNSPDVVFRLRSKGFGIKCERVEAVDRDGLACHYGRYHLRPESRPAAILALSVGGNHE